MHRSSPRILFLTDHCAGATAGYGLRVTNTVRDLRRIGPVTVVFLVREVDDNQWPAEFTPRPDDPDFRLITMAATEELSRVGYLTTTMTGRPRDAVYRNRGQLAKQLRPLIPDHDLIWSFRARPFDVIAAAAENGQVIPPVVVDFDDLYDEFHWQRFKSPGLGLARAGALLLSRQWRKHQRRVAEAVSTVLVTHEEDRRRLNELGHTNVDVLPNGYPHCRPAQRASDRCTMILVGGHHYAPNAEAAKILAYEVLPMVCSVIPDAELVLVGRPGPQTEQISRRPGVRYVGFAEDLDVVFDQATVVCTPIRTGSGSRLKVLEALARRIPLVSTEFGSHGFDLVEDRHYLRADDAETMAEAVVALHRDQALTNRLIDAAHRHFVRRFDDQAIEARTAEIAANTLGAVGTGQRPGGSAMFIN